MERTELASNSTRERTEATERARRVAQADCPSCRSGHVRRVGVFEHTTCGFVDVAARFGGIETRIDCPKCETTLSVTNDHLRCVAFLFCCSGCNRRFDGVPLTTSALQAGECD
ncbi:hypothetical protein SAMN04487950_3588 [Halogranum rubrum]|uniref:Thaumarchaeal output domain-containing protein n=1 Tax=Halogranum rubrum TaxID=553466 RepID=A0A1I4HB55_9EURY|nr:hypothetical protein [Halogranum rubrum]SFL38837.1 hypothetical protein SAMN04487950_3588 [Halogranum rubrum]